MKCPKCNIDYEDGWTVCLIDGASLVDTADEKQVEQVRDKDFKSKDISQQAEATPKSKKVDSNEKAAPLVGSPQIISAIFVMMGTALAFIAFNYLGRLVIYLIIVGVPSGIAGVIISEIYGKITSVSDEDKHIVFISATSLIAVAIVIYLFSQGWIDFSPESVLVTEL